MHIKVSTLKIKKWRFSKKITATSALLALFIISGTVYGYTTLNNKPAASEKTINTEPTQTNLYETKASPSAHATTEQVSEEVSTSEPKPTSNIPTSQPKASDITRSNTPEVYRPASLLVTELKAYGGELCDGTTYKLGLKSAIIFTNGRPGPVEWRIEGLRNGVTETVSTGTLQIAENRHTNELQFNYAYYMGQPISTETGIRLRITSPNDIASSWVYPSGILQGESPCAWPDGN